MQTENQLEQAKYLLKKILKSRAPGWHTCPQEEDLLTQEIELFLLQFDMKDRDHKKARYKQVDLLEQINTILKKKE